MMSEKPVSTETNKSWKIRKRSKKEVKTMNPEVMDITLGYAHDVDLFYLEMTDWDGEVSEIDIYPNDLPILQKLFSQALKECKNAGWWK